MMEGMCDENDEKQHNNDILSAAIVASSTPCCNATFAAENTRPPGSGLIAISTVSVPFIVKTAASRGLLSNGYCGPHEMPARNTPGCDTGSRLSSNDPIFKMKLAPALDCSTLLMVVHCSIVSPGAMLALFDPVRVLKLKLEFTYVPDVPMFEMICCTSDVICDCALELLAMYDDCNDP